MIRQPHCREVLSFDDDFLLVSQFNVTGALYTCRPDLAGFVNGLPPVVIELKKPGVPARAAFDENLTHYCARQWRRSRKAWLPDSAKLAPALTVPFEGKVPTANPSHPLGARRRLTVPATATRQKFVATTRRIR